ncbi:MAG: hypothetical protein ABIS14_09990 [Sphingomonas sp.]
MNSHQPISTTHRFKRQRNNFLGAEMLIVRKGRRGLRLYDIRKNSQSPN